MPPSTAAVRLLAGDKEPVRLATTVNIALSGLQTIDGVLTEAGDRVLVKDQTDSTENGIYTVSVGAWRRAPDAASDRTLISGMKVAVQEGTAHASDVWNLTTDRPNLGTDNIAFALYLNTVIANDINTARETLVAEMDAIISTAMNAGKATQAEAEAGTSNVGWMTPLRVAQAINDFVSITPLGGRLSLTSGTPVTTTDVAAATSIYYPPQISDWVRIWDGTSDILRQFTEPALALDGNAGHTGYHQSGKNFDLFLAWDGSAVVLGSGPAWSTDSLRGSGAGTTEIEMYAGLWRNKNSITLRIGSASGDTIVVPARLATFVGSFRTTATGQTSDTVLRRMLSNAYNPAPRYMYANAETLGTTWNYTLLTWRQVNANTANKIEFLQCLPGGPVECTAFSSAAHSTGSATKYVGVGVNSVTVNSGKGGLLPTAAANMQAQGYADYSAFASLGYTYLAWLEISAAAGTTTWYAGDSAAAAVFSNGIRAKVWN